MEWYWWIMIFGWAVGWISQVAKADGLAYKQNIKMPLGIWILFFFTWPYWYFYYKS